VNVDIGYAQLFVGNADVNDMSSTGGVSIGAEKPPKARFSFEGEQERSTDARFGQSCSVSSEALPPAAVVLTVKVRSVAKRSR
jgi:hypothetical protein